MKHKPYTDNELDALNEMAGQPMDRALFRQKYPALFKARSEGAIWQKVLKLKGAVPKVVKRRKRKAQTQEAEPQYEVRHARYCPSCGCNIEAVEIAMKI